MSGWMENWSDIATAKEIPEAVFDKARVNRGRLVRKWGAALLVLVVAFEAFLVAAGIMPLKQAFLAFVPPVAGAGLFGFFFQQT
jgi:hypothetical protein